MTAIRDRIASLLYGLTLPGTALRLIFRERRLIAWSAVPIVLTLALSIWGVAFVKAKLVGMGIHWLAGLGYSPDSFAVHAAMIFLQIVLFVLAAISFSFFAGVIASPFNDFLAEAAEPFAIPPLPPAPSGVKGKLRAFLIDVVKTVAVTAIQIGLVFIGVIGFWLPGLNLIPFAAAFWLLAFQFVSYPQTRRGEGLRASVGFLGRHLFATLGFGATIGFLFAIPILSSFALPLAVVGGTLLYARAAAPEEAGKFRLR
jgi:CysZ protein